MTLDPLDEIENPRVCRVLLPELTLKFNVQDRVVPSLPPGYCLLQEEGKPARILAPPSDGCPRGARIRRLGELRVLHSKGRCLELKSQHINQLRSGTRELG